MKLKSLWRWFRLIQYGKPVFVGYFKLDGWKETLPFYSWYCKECNKFVINYPSSHSEILNCPLCIKKVIMERENRYDSLPL
jgi:hypothetical protein